MSLNEITSNQLLHLKMPRVELFFLIAIVLFINSVTVQAEFKQLNVIFRHGDRAPKNDGLEMYPNDPFINDSFEPTGLGRLTNSGKMRAYALGTHLRKQYGDFLGDIYHASEVSARCTNSDRTKMTLQLVLAGLYPPTISQRWHKFLNWQPIPYNYFRSIDDSLLLPAQCPKYLKAREKAEATEEYQKRLKVFETLMKNLTDVTGRSIKSSNDMYYLWMTLRHEQVMNVTLPDWTSRIHPNGSFLDGTILEYDIASFNDEMKRLNGGVFLRKITDDMVLSTQTNGNIRNQKIKLYSGHDINVATVLQILGVNISYPPEFTSAVIIELHENEGVHSVKAKYYKGIPSEEEEIFIEGCGSPCTIERFINILSKYLPSDEDLKCDKRWLAAELENNRIDFAVANIKYVFMDLVTSNNVQGILQK